MLSTLTNRVRVANAIARYAHTTWTCLARVATATTPADRAAAFRAIRDAAGTVVEVAECQSNRVATEAIIAHHLCEAAEILAHAEESHDSDRRRFGCAGTQLEMATDPFGQPMGSGVMAWPALDRLATAGDLAERGDLVLEWRALLPRQAEYYVATGGFLTTVARAYYRAAGLSRRAARSRQAAIGRMAACCRHAARLTPNPLLAENAVTAWTVARDANAHERDQAVTANIDAHLDLVAWIIRSVWPSATEITIELSGTAAAPRVRWTGIQLDDGFVRFSLAGSHMCAPVRDMVEAGMANAVNFYVTHTRMDEIGWDSLGGNSLRRWVPLPAEDPSSATPPASAEHDMLTLLRETDAEHPALVADAVAGYRLDTDIETYWVYPPEAAELGTLITVLADATAETVGPRQPCIPLDPCADAIPDERTTRPHATAAAALHWAATSMDRQRVLFGR